MFSHLWPPRAEPTLHCRSCTCNYACPANASCAVEYGREGKRRFIVASRAHFWQRYRWVVGVESQGWLCSKRRRVGDAHAFHVLAHVLQPATPQCNQLLASNQRSSVPLNLPQCSAMVQRHYYEIIRAGAPCHLYFGAQLCCCCSVLGPTSLLPPLLRLLPQRGKLIHTLPHKSVLRKSADLEFSKEDNPGVDGAAAVDALLSLLRDALRERFGLDMQVSLYACHAEPAAQCAAGTLWRGLRCSP